MNVQFSPQVEAQVAAAAHQNGIDMTAVLEKLVTEHLPPIKQKPLEKRSDARSVDTENDASIALLESWIAQAPTDPDEIREAEKDLLEFKRNMNRWRKEAGARLLYPEAEK